MYFYFSLGKTTGIVFLLQVHSTPFYVVKFYSAVPAADKVFNFNLLSKVKKSNAKTKLLLHRLQTWKF